jgi:hypothetical protein
MTSAGELRSTCGRWCPSVTLPAGCSTRWPRDLVSIMLHFPLPDGGLGNLMPDISDGNTLRTWQTPRGQFLDHHDAHAKAQELLKGGIAGTGKKYDSADVAGKIIELVFGETSDARGVHCETALATLGALAGFAVQMGIREEFVKSGKITKGNAFTTISTTNGGTYFFGDLINEGLVAYRQGHYSVWTFIAGAAQQLGAKALPDLNDLFAHVARSVGSSDFGVPRLPPQNTPRQLPFELLDKFWNPVRLQLAVSVTSPSQWPFVLALAAQLVMIKAKDVIEPGIAARIVMEAAVPMSKVDPRRVHAAFFWPADALVL